MVLFLNNRPYIFILFLDMVILLAFLDRSSFSQCSSEDVNLVVTTAGVDTALVDPSALTR